MLLYHGTPATYPSHDGQRMLAVRFAQPVAVDDIVVHPPGVACLSGVSQTSEHEFTADVYLNVVDATPINALARTALHVVKSPHALRFSVGMSGSGVSSPVLSPLAVPNVVPGNDTGAADDSGSTGQSERVASETARTRLVILRTPAERITLSLYGVGADPGEKRDAAASQRSDLPTPSPVTAIDSLDLPDAESLMPLVSNPETRQRASLALAILARGRLTLATFLSLDLSPLSSLAEEDAVPVLSAVLGIDPPPRALTALLSLRTWEDAPATALESPLHASTSQAYTLLLLARDLCSSPHPNTARNTAYLVKHLSRLVTEPFGAHLIRALPPLAVNASMRGAAVSLALPVSHARVVVEALVRASVEVIDGISAMQAATDLAEPYLAHLSPSDPLVLALGPTASSTDSDTSLEPAPPLTAVQASFAASLSSPSSSALHALRPADMLAVLAPALLHALSTAPEPPLGIEPTRTARAGAQASDWAGKVYSRDEFRRDRDGRAGLAAGLSAGAGGGGASAGAGLGLPPVIEAAAGQSYPGVPGAIGLSEMGAPGQQYGAFAQSGLGAPGYGAAGRKASRHVDDFVA